MKLNVDQFRYLERNDWRILQALELLQRNHEYCPIVLVQKVSGLNRSLTFKTLRGLCKHKLVVHWGQSYDGWKTTYLGYDYLALKAFASRDSVKTIGHRIGVGKESDVHECIGETGDSIILKLHRLGRISFRAVKSKRDYMGKRMHASWQYMAKLAAAREYEYLNKLFIMGFPVPTPLDYNRHGVVMSFVPGTLMQNVHHLENPYQVLEECMSLIVKFATNGLIHGDFNEFNLIVTPEEHIVVIDFPQIVSINHREAEVMFDRDVQCIIDFFRRRFKVDVTEYPTFDEIRESVNFADFLPKTRRELKIENAIQLNPEEANSSDSSSASDSSEGEDDEDDSLEVEDWEVIQTGKEALVL